MARGREPDHRALEFSNRERDRSPIREIGDMTSDPESATARIFVGSLTPNITRPMLENHFSRWGNIVGVTLTKSKFGFVQFGTETEAQACLAAGPCTVINGERLDVKPARVGPGQGAAPPPAPGLGNNMKPGPSGYGGGGGGGGSWGARDTRDNYGGGRDHLPPTRDDPYYDPYYSGGKSRESEGQRYDDYYRDYYDHPGAGGSSASDSYYRNEVEPRPPPTRSYESPYAYPSEPVDPLDPMRPNDVEIVVPNKAQRGYAESIEAQLKRMNLLVDLLFPPPDITPTRVLNDLAERHCLFAIFATTENEKHRSLTLNILHGDPQEHRNMPVEDALRLIQRNFEDYVKQTRSRNMRQVVPRDIRNLLLDLLEMRSLSMGDLDKLIKYLRERQNALVDDQIEQKREIAETQSSLVAGGSMTVTYPGYNYITSTVPGAVTDTNPASVAAAATPQGIIPTGAGAPSAVAQSQASMNIVSSPNAAAAIAAYPATAYTTTGVIGAYGVTQQSQTQHQIMAAPPSAVPAPAPPPPPQSKQADLQERILNLMKSQSGLAQGGIPVATGVPGPPTGVPPPSLVQDARMVQHQQQHQHQHQQPNQSLWMQHGAPAPDNNDKVQGSQHTYNPWSQ